MSGKNSKKIVLLLSVSVIFCLMATSCLSFLVATVGGIIFNYSDRLSEMAEALGGTKMPASDFDHYKPIIESVFNGNAVSPKIEVELPFNAKAKLTRQFAVYINTATNNVHVSAIDENNKVQLPTSITKFYTVSRAAIGTLNKGKPSDDKALYGIAYVLADKLDYDAVEDVLNATGDKKFIEMYQSSFGKQKLFAFQNELGAAIGDASKRGEIDPNYKPNTDPFCVIDFFNEIAEEENLIRICSDKFSYNRTGAKTVDKVELTEEEQQKLAKAKTASEVQKIMDSHKHSGKKSNYLCSGLVYCGCCGAKMHVYRRQKKGHEYIDYRCSVACGNSMVHVADVDTVAKAFQRLKRFHIAEIIIQHFFANLRVFFRIPFCSIAKVV